MKALAALKHLASYLDGTPDHGVLLQATEEGKILFDFWRDDELIFDEATIPDVTSRAHFNLEAFSDSSWADCKSARKSTSSGCIFLNGALILSACRTQASIALSSCEAELYAANGLMVESIYLFRLCKFLCGDSSDVNSEMVQQKLYMDSSSALALVRRTGTGRFKHIQIKQFFLQDLLRKEVFTIHKINTKLNPGDMNTKRLSGERRKFLSKLMSLFSANADEEHDDNKIRQIRKVNVSTRKQCIRLIQMAGTAMGICLQLEGCMNENSEPVAGGNVAETYDDWQLAFWMLAEWCLSSFGDTAVGIAWVMQWLIFYMVQFAGIAVLATMMAIYMAGPLVWRHYVVLRRITLRHAPLLMEVRFRIIRTALWVGWWLLREEIRYLHSRFRDSNQQGDMMVDFETIYNSLDEYLTEGQHPVGAAEALGPDVVEEPPVDQPVFPEGVDLAELALSHVQRNGTTIDRSVGETQADEERDVEMEGDESEPGETPSSKFQTSSIP